MTELVDPSKIEELVGVNRHAEWHYVRAVDDEQIVYILHSQECVDSTPDLRDCPYSQALDHGLPAGWDFYLDRPVRAVLEPSYSYPATEKILLPHPDEVPSTP